MEDYIFSSTYLRTIEKWLLDKTDLQRMIGAENPERALRVLEDTNYAKEFKGLISKTPPQEYRKILLDDMRLAKELLYKLTKDKHLIILLLSFFDFYNLKIFFKEKFFGLNLQKFISFHSSQLPEELKKAVKGEKKAKINPLFKKIIEKANEKFKEGKDPFFIENYLDKERFRLSLFLAKKIKSKWILNYFKRKIDLFNLSNIIRLYYLGRKEKIKEVLVEGGNIKWEKEKLEKFENMRELIAFLSKKFDLKVRESLEKYLEEGNLWKLMRRLKNLDIEYLKTSKFISVGPEVILAYFVARQNANRNVRIVMEGKLFGIKNSEIQERVRAPF